MGDEMRYIANLTIFGLLLVIYATTFWAIGFDYGHRDGVADVLVGIIDPQQYFIDNDYLLRGE